MINETNKKVEITEQDINDYLSKIGSQNGSINDGDIVSYNGKYYIAKAIKLAENNEIRYTLFTLNGEATQFELLKASDIQYVMSSALYNQLVDLKSKGLSIDSIGDTTTSGGTSGGGYSGGGYSGGTSFTRSGKNYNTNQPTDTNTVTKTGADTQAFSDKLGSTATTKKTLAECQGTITKAQNAINTANITVKTWSDAQNAQGHATDASIVYLNNLTKALDTLEKNLDKTQVSALEVDALNTNVKDLLIEFTEKKDKEDEVAEKEEKLSGMQETIETTDKDGNKTTKTNEEYTKIKNEITKLKEEIAKIDKKIEELQNEIDARFKKIKEKYGGLLNFDSSSGISIPGNTIFGTSGNTNGRSIEIDGDVIKNYMVSNNLEYFEFENSIYNVPSPYDPWNKTVINLDEKYLIRYDLDKLQSYANSGNQIAAGAITFLREKAAGRIPSSVRSFIDTQDNCSMVIYTNGRYQSLSGSYKGQIQQVMDTVLQDSYVANNCQTVADYATTSMMTLSGGIFNPTYNGSAKPTQKGISGVLDGADCIGAVNWAMCQGIIFSGERQGGLQALGLGYGLRAISGGYDGTSICDVGTVFTKKTPDNWHTGMVVGHTTINGQKYNVIVHTGNKAYGFNAHIVGNGSYDTAITADRLSSAYYA